MTQNGGSNRLERLEAMLTTHAEMLNQLTRMALRKAVRFAA
ncbi:hypothetical protein [Anabaena azotica]|nr:hypothetical protein [Anabaena azotica]